MHRSRAALFALALMCPAVAGCEFVFGLDDYAQASSESTTGGSSGTDAGPGSGATSSVSSGSDGSGNGEGGGGTGGGGTGGTGGEANSSTSTGEGGDPGCPCVPEGWTLVEAHPTTADTPVFTCDLNVTADRLGEATVACSCTCGPTNDLECRLACWSDSACTGTVTLKEGSFLITFCESMPTAQSCQLALTRDDAVTTDICTGTATVGEVTRDNPLDLCAASSVGATCGDEGVCSPPPEGALWCIQGTEGEACPPGWPDAHDLVDGGTPTCDVCECSDEVTCNGNWRVASPGGLCTYNEEDIESRQCSEVVEAIRWHGGPAGFQGSDAVGGACTAVNSNPTGRLDGATASKLCCIPPA